MNLMRILNCIFGSNLELYDVRSELLVPTGATVRWNVIGTSEHLHLFLLLFLLFFS